MTTVYLAGPMSGYENHNYAAFKEATEKLRKLGLRVESPHEIDERFPNRAHYNDPDQEWLWYMLQCVPMVFKSDIIVMLSGWEKSRGACLERSIAQERKIPMFLYGSNEFERALDLLALSA